MTPFRLALLAYMVLAQLVAWLCWKKWLKSLLARSIVKTVYIVVNMVTALAIVQMYALELIPPDRFLWAYLYRPSLTWFFGHAMWLGLAFIIWLGSMAFRPFFSGPPKGLPQLFRAKKWRLSVSQAVLMAWLFALGASFYGYWVQQGPANVRRIAISAPDLPPELDGLRIVHLSDFHYGLGSDYRDLSRRLAQAADLRPDLVIFTGDLLDSKSSLARDWREPLKVLDQTRFGSYGVLGNHDLYADNPAEEARVLTALGVRILRDEAVHLPEAPLTIVGFDDPGTRSVFYKSDPNANSLDFKAIAGRPAPQGNFVMVVRHRPQGLAIAAQAGAQLYLAGHTHGGQFQFPWIPRLNLMTFSTPYTQGIYRLGQTALVISNGLASAGLPFRLWAWPEIGLITLTKGPSRATTSLSR